MTRARRDYDWRVNIREIFLLRFGRRRRLRGFTLLLCLSYVGLNGHATCTLLSHGKRDCMRE